MTQINGDLVKLNIPARGPQGLKGVDGDQGPQGLAGPIGDPALIPFPISNATGTVDAITVDYSPNITLADTTIVAFRSSGENTSSTPTFNPDGSGALVITKNGGQPLEEGDISNVNSVHLLGLDTVNNRWELINPTINLPNVIDGGTVV